MRVGERQMKDSLRRKKRMKDVRKIKSGMLIVVVIAEAGKERGGEKKEKVEREVGGHW